MTLLWEDASPAKAALCGSAACPSAVDTKGGAGSSGEGFTPPWLPLSCVLGQHVRQHWKSSRLFGKFSADVVGSFLVPHGESSVPGSCARSGMYMVQAGDGTCASCSELRPWPLGNSFCLCAVG